jgi:hypothetical protein
MMKKRWNNRNATTISYGIATFFLVLVLITSCSPTETATPPVITDTPVIITPTVSVPAPVTETPTVTITDTPIVPTTTGDAPGPLPDMPNKPVPASSTFQGCPPQGDGGDPQLNLLKNRVDDGNYIPVTFDSVINLTWPKTIERKDRAKWSAEDTATVSKYEGIPVMVEGYLFGAKAQGAESTNCHGTTPDMVDWHIWLTKTAGGDRTHSIVIEATPRIRPNHKWTTKLLEQLAKDKTEVRISGWLFLDPEHPDQVGLTRGTIWEIHPIMQIEVQQNGTWVPLDKLAP